jgi:ADP-ribose pyrophosphatase YjhB (NUDIX family)
MSNKLPQSVAAFALIRRVEQCQTLWLAQWNPRWGCYNFVGGHKRPDESFRDCVAREVSEELGLHAGKNCSVAADPVAHLTYSAWSASARQNTQYTIELFEVGLADSDARSNVDANPDNRWISEREILTKCCDDGKPVSDTMELLLSKVNLITGITREPQGNRDDKTIAS